MQLILILVITLQIQPPLTAVPLQGKNLRGLLGTCRCKPYNSIEIRDSFVQVETKSPSQSQPFCLLSHRRLDASLGGELDSVHLATLFPSCLNHMPFLICG